MQNYLTQPGGFYGTGLGNSGAMAASPFGSSNLYNAMAQMGGRYDPSAPGNGAAMSNLPYGANAANTANATFYRGLPPGFTKTVS